MLRFEIPGVPTPWAAHAGFGRKSFNPRLKEKIYVHWHLKNQNLNNPVLTCPVRLHLLFLLPIPKNLVRSYQKHKEAGSHLCHVRKPDVSNLTKFIEDCLKGIVISDDSLVCAIQSCKMYDENPRTIIEVEEIPIRALDVWRNRYNVVG